MRLARTSLAAASRTPRTLRPLPLQAFSTATSAHRASVVSLFGAEPMPGAPAPSATTAHTSSRAQAAAADSERVAEERAVRIARRAAARDALARSKAGGRFWTAARVQEDSEVLVVALDSRPVRHPTTKELLRLPARKRLLAHALALEWDQLTSVRQTAQGHRVPLMSLVCRAVDLGGEDAGDSDQIAARRAPLIQDLLRYLDTDSLLCWQDEGGEAREVAMSQQTLPLTLHQLQARTATPILEFLHGHVWPGVRVEPVLGYEGATSTLLPRPHAPETRQAVQRWLEGLSGWDLAGIERATLAGKSLVVAARLVGGWRSAEQSEEKALFAPFTVEDAVAATNMETAFQTALWGEVEDTHDVDAADMRRHFGSVVLLVAE